jgi:hydrogenase-4 component B
MMVSEGSELIGLLLNAFIIVLLTGIITLPFIPLKFKSLITTFIVLGLALVTSTLAFIAFSSGEIEYIFNGGAFFGNIPLRIDALSAWFILIINLTSSTGVIYGSGYLKSATAPSSLMNLHWILYIIFHSSMILVCMVQHSIVFIIVWEFMSLSSFLLVMFEYTNPKVIKAGINYLVQMHLSVISLTVAFIWVFVKTGTFDFKGIAVFFDLNTNKWLFLIFFTGFGLKAGFMGLHTWLPQAHPAAPSHISGVMSGVIVKLGIYGIFRVITFLKTDFILLGDIILTLSILTGLFGIMNAAVHRDFKKMLAYCTIENIGIIGVGIGLGLLGMGKDQSVLIFLGFGGALLHVLNHSLYKSLLFFSTGSVYSQTHTRDMDKLGGLIRKMPQTAILFLAGALAIGGIPPLNGFISEFLIYSGILKGISSAGISQVTLMILTFAGMSLIGGISILTFTKTFGTIFLGTPRQKLKHEPAEVSFSMLLPQYLILFVMVLIGFFPGYPINLVGKILASNSFPEFSLDSSGLNGYVSLMRNISIASVLFLIIVGLMFLIRWFLAQKNERLYESTWGCAYVAPNSRMQYTGKSYSKSFGKLLNFVMIEKKAYTEIKKDEVFPESRKYRSFYLDFFETRIINPSILQITRFINLFQFVQNGKIQAYVIYGIVFILVIFIGTVLNFWP